MIELPLTNLLRSLAVQEQKHYTALMKFNPEVTTGHIIQALTVAATAIGLFIGLDRRIIFIEAISRANSESIIKHEETLQRIIKVESDIVAAQVRITTILEERSKKP